MELKEAQVWGNVPSNSREDALSCWRFGRNLDGNKGSLPELKCVESKEELEDWSNYEKIRESELREK